MQNQIISTATHIVLAGIRKAHRIPNHVRHRLLGTRAAKRAELCRKERKETFGAFGRGLTHHFTRGNKNA